MDSIEARLDALTEQGLRRTRRQLDSAQGTHITLDGRECLSFASNDYLGLAAHPSLSAAACRATERFGVGGGASHLLSGHHRLHQRLEDELAAFAGLPAALLFSSGYLVNLGVVTALVGRNGAVFADRLNHASLVDAAQLSRARHQRYRHCDLDHLERLLRKSPAEHKLIATDAVFSMDGDIAPVPDLLALAERYGAHLYLDDAHGFGVLGQDGRGVLEHFGLAPPFTSPIVPHPSLIYLATLGKAAGVSGAFVAGPEPMIEWLVNKARSYIYTTAQPPMLAAAASASLALIAGEPQRRRHLRELIARLKAGAARLPWSLMPSETPIQPMLIGGNREALHISEGLLERGILLPAIRPPTVPEGTARLRISLSAAHQAEDIDRLLAALEELA